MSIPACNFEYICYYIIYVLQPAHCVCANHSDKLQTDGCSFNRKLWIDKGDNMRNKRETDISQYKKDIQQNELSEKADGGVKRFSGVLASSWLPFVRYAWLLCLLRAFHLLSTFSPLRPSLRASTSRQSLWTRQAEYIFRMRIQRNLRSIRNYTIPRTESGLTIRIFLRQWKMRLSQLRTSVSLTTTVLTGAEHFPPLQILQPVRLIRRFNNHPAAH